MLCNYKIIRSKTTKGAFTYYTITEGQGVSKMLIYDYRGWQGGWPCDEIS